jgi:hypothetical protein
MPFVLSQPIKGLYVLAALGFELARFPLFLAKYLHSYGRQHPAWTFRQALGVRVYFSLVYHLATAKVAPDLPLTPDNEKERWVILEPAKEQMYKGPLRSNADVKPAKIGATWYATSMHELHV